MNRTELVAQIKEKQSFLCVGLDSDPDRIPAHLGTGPEAIIQFNKAIIEATAPFAVAYKPNLAFYEALGRAGWYVLEESLKAVPKDCFIIADAKRGDIGNTATQYAHAFFNELDCDAVTLSPYMGKDSITPFLGRSGKWAIMLGVTSNKGAEDVQFRNTASQRPLYEEVIETGMEWGGPDELMFVVGATRPDLLKRVREIAPEHFFLVPGVGSQGGDLAAVMEAGMNRDCGLLVNSSRGIIFASSGEDFAKQAQEKAKELQTQMAKGLQEVGL